ncbi:hypothetical protein Dda_5169 [Drechslerella dactyloides]|uniref:Uncharacterized protein n=1 Tax=Drechslerella dactyloides TaxID=74499 RepID=A0AAD6IWA9_DREDA|nr:hypothetical protein Dda_5169 [Drechslerella dactyloides]
MASRLSSRAILRRHIVRGITTGMILAVPVSLIVYGQNRYFHYFYKKRPYEIPSTDFDNKSTKKFLSNYGERFRADLHAARSNLASSLSTNGKSGVLDQWLQEQSKQLLQSLGYRQMQLQEYNKDRKISNFPSFARDDRLSYDWVTDALPTAMESLADDAQRFFDRMLKEMGFPESTTQIKTYEYGRREKVITLKIRFPASKPEATETPAQNR